MSKSDDDLMEGLDMKISGVFGPAVSDTPRGRRALESKRSSKANAAKSRKTGRTTQFNLKCREEWKAEVTAFARANGALPIEVLEKAWEHYKRTGNRR